MDKFEEILCEHRQHHSPLESQGFETLICGEEYACYGSLLYQIAQLLQQKKAVIVAIDGRCGSGKTSLANLIASLFPCNQIRMDHFFLPVNRRSPSWQDSVGGNMDLARFRREVSDALQTRILHSYQAFDCRSQSFYEISLRPDVPLTIVEGSYSLHPANGLTPDLSIFLTCSDQVQEERLRRREGSRFQNFLDLWIPMEERYHVSCSVQEHASVVIDTGAFFR